MRVAGRRSPGSGGGERAAVVYGERERVGALPAVPHCQLLLQLATSHGSAGRGAALVVSSPPVFLLPPTSVPLKALGYLHESPGGVLFRRIVAS